MADRPESRDWRSMHLWQFQPVRDLLIVAALIAILYVGYRVSLVSVPMLLAMLLAYMFEPLVRALTARRWFSRPGVAIAIIVAAFFVIVVPVSIGVGTAAIQGVKMARDVAGKCQNVLTVVRFSRDTRETLPGQKYGTISWEPTGPESTKTLPVFVGISEQGAAFAKDANAAFAKLPPNLQPLVIKLVEKDHPQEKSEPPAPEAERDSDMHALLESSIIWVQDHASIIGAALSEKALGSGAEAVGTALRTFRSIAHLGLTLLLTAFFFFFFSTGYGKVLSFWEGLIPERKKSRVMELLEKMDRVIAGFIRGRLTICATLMLYYTGAYWFMGVPAPLLIGPIVGAMAIVPFITILAMPIAVVLMVLEPSGWAFEQHWWWVVGAPIGAYLVERALDDYILTPTIQGKHTEMAFPAILFSSLAGGVLAGVYGLLIAIPVAACLKIVLKEVFWPRFQAWAEGRERDFLPISHEDDKPEFDPPPDEPRRYEPRMK